MKNILALIIGIMLIGFIGQSAANAAGGNHVTAQNIVIVLLVGTLIISASSVARGALGAYVNVTVSKPGNNTGVGGNHKDMVVVFDWDDVASGYDRDSKGIVITGPLVMKAGKYMIELYGTLSTFEGTSDSEGDPDSKGVKQGVKFSHPGNKQEIREFRANWLNKNIGIIDRKCDGSTPDMYGSICNPLQLNFKAKNNKDANNAEMEFMSILKGPDVALYEGTLTLDTVRATAAADATTIDVVLGEGQYQLTTGTMSPVTITTLSNAVDGLVVTLLGSGGAYPSIITAANDFILKNGTQWTANTGSQITFKAYKNGVSTYKFFEQSRS